MSRAGKTYNTTPYCLECGRFKTKYEGPWMQHPIDYGWWCGCGGDEPGPVDDPLTREERRLASEGKWPFDG